MNTSAEGLGNWLKLEIARNSRGDRYRNYSRSGLYSHRGHRGGYRFLSERELTEWYAAIERARSARVVLKLQEEK